jgi:hypothetical protein
VLYKDSHARMEESVGNLFPEVNFEWKANLGVCSESRFWLIFIENIGLKPA